MKSNLGQEVLDGVYLVYYDLAKTKLMARIGFKDGVTNGTIERYDMTGNKVYSAVIQEAAIRGVLSILKNSKSILRVEYTTDVAVSTTLTLGNIYEYNTPKYEPDSFKVNSVTGVPIYEVAFSVHDKLETLERYIGGTKRSTVSYRDGVLYGDSVETFNTEVTRINYTYEDGLIVSPVAVYHSLFNRDINLTFSGTNTLSSIGD